MAKMKHTVGDYVSDKLGNAVFVQSQVNSYVISSLLRNVNYLSTSQIRYRKRLSNISALWQSISSAHIKKKSKCFKLFTVLNLLK